MLLGEVLSYAQGDQGGNLFLPEDGRQNTIKKERKNTLHKQKKVCNLLGKGGGVYNERFMLGRKGELGWFIDTITLENYRCR